MAIIGLTTDVAPRFPEIGKLHKGDAMQNGRAGKELDYWRFAAEDERVRKAFQEAFGSQPKIINVLMPFATVDEVWDCWQEEWGQTGLVHRCNGQYMVRWRNADGTYTDDPECTERRACNGKCKATGRLTVVIPELLDRGIVGYVTMETHSKYDLRLITGAFGEALMWGLGSGPNGLAGSIWELKRVPRMIVARADDGKRMRVRKTLVQLVPEAAWMQRQWQRLRRPQLAAGDVVAPAPELEAGDGDVIDDGEIIEGSYADAERRDSEEASAGDGTRDRTGDGDGDGLIDPTVGAQDDSPLALVNGQLVNTETGQILAPEDVARAGEAALDALEAVVTKARSTQEALAGGSTLDELEDVVNAKGEPVRDEHGNIAQKPVEPPQKAPQRRAAPARGSDTGRQASARPTGSQGAQRASGQGGNNADDDPDLKAVRPRAGVRSAPAVATALREAVQRIGGRQDRNGNPITQVPGTQAQRQLVVSLLNKALDGTGSPNTARHALLKYVWGIGSSLDLSYAQSKVMLAWLLGGGKDQGYPLHEVAAQEAMLLVQVAGYAQEQPALSEAEPVPF
jgi:hypothetical protein